MAEHSMCHPGRPRPQGLGQKGSTTSLPYRQWLSARIRKTDRDNAHLLGLLPQRKVCRLPLLRLTALRQLALALR